MFMQFLVNELTHAETLMACVSYCKCNISWDAYIFGLTLSMLAMLQLNQPSFTLHPDAPLCFWVKRCEWTDKFGRYRERLNTRRGACHCFGDLQEGFYVFSCSLAAAECQCWIPVTQYFLLFCTIRSMPHRQRYKAVPLGLLWPIFSVCVFCYYYCTPQSVLTDLIQKEYFSFIRTTKKIM